jgi:hypothetical protein
VGTTDQFIPHLEQYCDRWCERCQLTARCAAFAERASHGGGALASPTAADAWQELQSALETALKVLQRARAATSPGPRAHRWADPARDACSSQPADPVTTAARAYLRLVVAWLEAERGWLHDKRLAIRRQLQASADPAAAVTAAEALCDALDVIAWDYSLIPAVLHKAVTERASGRRGGSAEGLAKLALVSIDRSTSAWLRVRAARLGQPETVVPVLAQLDRLRRVVEGEFRGARTFVRPGFDACYH